MLIYSHGDTRKRRRAHAMMNGYKITCGKTTTYRALREDAKTTAHNLMVSAGQDAIVWMVTEKGPVKVFTIYKTRPRT
jgi:hypothetical protein